MTGKDLIDEGTRLARPCVHLRDAGPVKSYAAVWGGPGIVPAKRGSFKHWLTIDCSFLPNGPKRSGCMSVYTNEEDSESGVVEVDPLYELPPRTKGTKLYAHPQTSLPPLDGVFQLGSPAVSAWLAANNWEPTWGYNDNFKDKKPANEYERTWQANCPLYGSGVYAMLGGWHLPWPDGDWADLVDSDLIAWTFQDSEPWIEVWKKAGKYRIIERIT